MDLWARVRVRSHARSLARTCVCISRYNFMSVLVCVCVWVRIAQVRITPWDVLRHRHLFGRLAECYTYTSITVNSFVLIVCFLFLLFLVFNFIRIISEMILWKVNLIMKLKITTADFDCIYCQVPLKNAFCFFGKRITLFHNSLSEGGITLTSVREFRWRSVPWGEKCSFCV